MNIDSIIIGAGISGLVIAHRLKKLGRQVLLIESTDRIGGVIQTEEVEGFTIERGPNSLRGTHEFLDLVEELNLGAELVTAKPQLPAYVYADQQLHAVPMSPPALIKTRLISGSAKLRLLREPFVKKRREKVEESIASFVKRRLGPEILERLVAPFLSGVYAGDPERLSVQACFPKLAGFESESGSIFSGALGTFRAGRATRQSQPKPARSLRPYRLCSFRRGLQTLPQSLARSIGYGILTEARVTAVERITPGQLARVTIEDRHGQRTFETPILVIATPSFAAARLLHHYAPELTLLITGIQYAPIASVPLAYRADQITRPLDGFGFLAPRSEGLRMLGSIWNSTLFGDRAPDGWICTTNFIGGATDPEAAGLDPDELTRLVHQDLARVLSIKGAPRILPVTRYERAIPQYNLGHAARIAKISTALDNYPGLRQAGNYLPGVSLGDCIKQAEQIASEIHETIGVRQ